MEFPSRLFGVATTCVEGEYGFGDVAYERTSFAVREEGKEWVGTAAALWGITAGVYLALMGPQGMVETRTGDHAAGAIRHQKTESGVGCEDALRGHAPLQRVRRQLRQDRQDRPADQSGIARKRHLRRQGLERGFPVAWDRALCIA
ncbi:MAG: hypothetical protein MZV64_33450 [Ignavibacteriales bacterium]|nr:hypothetical protein [Ignavibacteriales bacterium]